MSKHTKVTLAKNGGDEAVVEVGSIAIPDLWHVAQAIRGRAPAASLEGKESQDTVAEAVLRVWHLAHDLKRHIVEQEEPTPMEALADTNWVVLDQMDLRVAIEMLKTMCNVLHQDQPTCGCGEPADLIVETESGQTRNITQHVPKVIAHLESKLEKPRAEKIH